MGEAYWAAREGDVLLHTSLIADIAGAAVEIACYTAITAAASFLILGAPFTGGTSALVLGVVVGIVMGASGGSSKISEFADWVSGLFPPSEDGRIKTGSPNTRTNGKPAARAAGTVDQSIELVDSSEQPQQPTTFIDIAAGIFGGAAMMAKEMVRPTVASPDPRAVPKENDKIICHKHPSSFSDLGSKYTEKLPDISPLGIIEGGIDIISAGWGTLTGSAEYMAEGSSKVYINGQPAVRSNDRSTCEAKVTDNCKGGVRVSNNVRIGGKPIVVREIKSGKHPINLIITVATAILRPGKLCTKIVCFGKDFFTGVALSYLTAQGTRAASTVFLGNPVHLPTGAKILKDQEELDFTIPAHFPIEWQRFYNSRDERTHNMFGAGWSVPYEVEMEISPQPDGSCSAVYIEEQGRRIEIEALQPGEGIRGVNENLSIRRGEQNRWIIEDDAGIYRLFEPDPNNPNRLYLTLLQDRNDNHLFIYRDQHSRISHISADNNTAAISLHYQDKRHPQRVTHIKRELADGSSQLLNQYHYSEQGDLQQVIDAENRSTREFAYDNGRRMIYHRLPTGLQCHYQWDSFSGSDGIEWRVIRHWSEADGKRLEDYRFQYDLSKHLTTAYDSLGRVSQHYWNEVYQLTRYIDVLGQTTEFEWNEDQQLISVTDPQGGKWHYSYDEQGRQTEETDPLGRTSQTQWLPHWALPTISVDPDGSIWRYYYDQRGNLRSVIDPHKQRTHYQYDPHGQIVEITDARGGKKYLRWNQNGQLIQHRDCSGTITELNYDQHNNLIAIVDAQCNSSKYHYNAAGQLTGVTLTDGRQEHYRVNSA
ncbi:DUF6531 domain-containing protein, partial [Snodgrassella alvi]|uniref:DUF6531 domain-containing protein n=1 Tax=Snodgrassella alvi TaxID=1196083 RepID=UPI0011848C2B